MATSDRKRKRETNEEDNNNNKNNMDTEQNSSVQFPQINPSQLQVKIYFNKTMREILAF